MENSPEKTSELKAIKYLLIAIALSLFLIAACLGYANYLSEKYVNSCDSKSTSAYDTAFRKQVDALIDDRKLDEAIVFASKYIKEKPIDPDGYWARAKAYYVKEEWQLAIDDFQTAEKINPSWKDGWTGPYIKQAEENLKNSGK